MAFGKKPKRMPPRKAAKKPAAKGRKADPFDMAARRVLGHTRVTRASHNR